MNIKYDRILSQKRVYSKSALESLPAETARLFFERWLSELVINTNYALKLLPIYEESADINYKWLKHVKVRPCLFANYDDDPEFLQLAYSIWFDDGFQFIVENPTEKTFNRVWNVVEHNYPNFKSYYLNKMPGSMEDVEACRAKRIFRSWWLVGYIGPIYEYEYDTHAKMLVLRHENIETESQQVFNSYTDEMYDLDEDLERLSSAINDDAILYRDAKYDADIDTIIRDVKCLWHELFRPADIKLKLQYENDKLPIEKLHDALYGDYIDADETVEVPFTLDVRIGVFQWELSGKRTRKGIEIRLPESDNLYHGALPTPITAFTKEPTKNLIDFMIGNTIQRHDRYFVGSQAIRLFQLTRYIDGSFGLPPRIIDEFMHIECNSAVPWEHKSDNIKDLFEHIFIGVSKAKENDTYHIEITGCPDYMKTPEILTEEIWKVELKDKVVAKCIEHKKGVTILERWYTKEELATKLIVMINLCGATSNPTYYNLTLHPMNLLPKEIPSFTHEDISNYNSQLNN